MIRIGYRQNQKREILKELLEKTEYDRIFCFHGHEQPDFDRLGVPVYYVPWSETEMYRTFYPLLGNPYQGREDVPAITKDSLLVVDEMLMHKDRSVLRYNCTHHFLRVSPHHVVFNWLPIIDEEKDFMILLDYDKPDKYKGRSISDLRYRSEDCRMIPRLPRLRKETVGITEKDGEAYIKKRDSLFDNLGQKDPNTVPRNLTLFAGNLKRSAIDQDHTFVSRNKRLKTWTYDTVPPADEIRIIDMHYSFSTFNEMLRRTGASEITYISTGLPVDEYHFRELEEWMKRMEKIYACSDLSE